MEQRPFKIARCMMPVVLLLSSCASMGPQNPPGHLDAGPLANYSRDGTVDRFAHSHGVMLVTFGGRLTAVSAICTHRGGIVDVDEKSDGFVCASDGSRFDRNGVVRQGPAREALPHYILSVNSANHVIVDSTQPLIQPLCGRPDSYLTAK